MSDALVDDEFVRARLAAGATREDAVRKSQAESRGGRAAGVQGVGGCQRVCCAQACLEEVRCTAAWGACSRDAEMAAGKEVTWLQDRWRAARRAAFTPHPRWVQVARKVLGGGMKDSTRQWRGANAGDASARGDGQQEGNEHE